jgi:hypothetical protein
VTRRGLNHARAAAIALQRSMSRPLSSAALQRSSSAIIAARRTDIPCTATATKRVGQHPAATAPPVPASTTNSNPHRPKPAYRGFVPPRLSYAFGARNSSGERAVRSQAYTLDKRTLGVEPLP